MRRAITQIFVTAAVLVPLTCARQDPDGYQPEQFCPEAPECESNEGPLLAGAAAVAITPTIDANTEVQTLDVDQDGEFDLRVDEFDDKNGNGRFDGIWIAGFGNGRAAKGVSDDQWARAIALRQGDTTIVLVSVDLVGYFFDEVEAIRASLADDDIDFLLVSATHSHEARDTVGIWGLTEDESGLDAAYMTFVRQQVAEAARQAVAALKPATLRHASLRTRDLPGGMLRYQSDARDPQIIDDQVRLMKLDGDAGTIATLVNWGSHPEYMGDENQLLSSDFPHWLRKGIEEGVAGPDGGTRPGVGGVAVYFQGAVGSQIGPGRLQAQRWDGAEVRRYTPEAASVVGSQIAWHALGALADATVDPDPRIGFARQSFFIDVQNRGYHTAILKKLFDRQAYNWNDEQALIPGQNEPDVKTEIATIDIGQAQIITVPGELDPALFVGGYDGSHTAAGSEIVDTSTRVKNPPDLTKAPGAPYLRDLARDDARHVYLFGLTNDMLGYFVPEFDYLLHPYNPYFDEAEGDHYEETNSVGIDGWPLVKTNLQSLLRWRATRDPS